MLAILLLASLSCADAYRFTVSSRAQECIYSDINGVDRVVAEIGVISGGNKDIVFKVRSNAPHCVYSRADQRPIGC